jgi:hypothetical protein
MNDASNRGKPIFRARQPTTRNELYHGPMDFYWYSEISSEAASKISGTTRSMSVSFVR